MPYTRPESRTRSRSIAERISFIVSVIIVACLVALIFYAWGTGKDSPPVLSVVTQSQIRQEDGQFYVPFTVTNQGGKTVESVQIVARLQNGGESTVWGSQQIEFLSGGESRSGAFVFDRQPQPDKLAVRATSYKLP